MSLATPTGVRLGEHEPETPEWFAARREGITGTDLPKILGLSKYGNALSVWLDKRGELPAEEAGEAADWGHLLEDIVATEWGRRRGEALMRVGTLAHVEHSWRRASLDRLLLGKNEALEVKTRSEWAAGQWREDMPDSVLAQVAWGRHVSGVDRIHVAVLIGGQRLKSFTYERDEDLEEYLIEQARAVWDCVTAGVPPQVEADGEGLLLDLLNRLYGLREGEVDLTERAKDVERLLGDYAAAGSAEGYAKKAKTRIKTELVQLLDAGDTAVLRGQRRFTYKAPAPAHVITADAMRDLRRSKPDLFADMVAGGFITTKTDGPRLNVAKRAITAEESVDA